MTKNFFIKSFSSILIMDLEQHTVHRLLKYKHEKKRKGVIHLETLNFI